MLALFDVPRPYFADCLSYENCPVSPRVSLDLPVASETPGDLRHGIISAGALAVDLSVAWSQAARLAWRRALRGLTTEF